MDAIIYCEKSETDDNSHPMLATSWDVAGTPLLIRQLEWLYENGFRRIIVEYSGTGEPIDPCLLGAHAVGSCVELLLTHQPVGPSELALRAGLIESPYLALSSNVLGTGSLKKLMAERPGTKGMLRPPSAMLDFMGADISLLQGSHPIVDQAVDLDGWGVVLECEHDAFLIGQRVLDHRLAGIVLHGAEVQAGVWVARGAIIDPSAKIQAPVWIGAKAVICAGANVGPNAIVGERAIVSPHATVRSAIVGANSFVGEGLELESCIVREEQLVDFATGTTVTMNDPVLLDSSVSDPRTVPLLCRLLALCTVFVVAPVLVLFEKGRIHLRQLWEIVRGTRSWIGAEHSSSELDDNSSLGRAARAAPAGFIAVDRIVAVTGEDRLRTLAWYAQAKSLRTDLRLLIQAISH